MYKSIEDVFNSSEAVINDPLYEIHNPVQSCDYPPEINEYDDLLNNINHTAYPLPVDKHIHNIINPLNGALKPIISKNYN